MAKRTKPTGTAETGPETGTVTLTLSEDLVADLTRSVVKEIERAQHKINLHKNNLQTELDNCHTAIENLRSLAPDHSFFASQSDIFESDK